MSARPLLIIQMGVPPQDITTRFGEQGRWMLDALGDIDSVLTEPERADSFIVVRPASGEALPPVESVAGAIITGSWDMVTDLEDWSELTAAWIRVAYSAELPMLGICYGHQLMAHALGGKVDFHPQGRELGCHALHMQAEVSNDPLLNHLPAHFNALLSHEQAVLEVPGCARVLARSAHDPHQILRYGDHALSVQFHPEFSPALMRACIERRAPELADDGVDMHAMLGKIEETPYAARILTRFALLALAGERAPEVSVDQSFGIGGQNESSGTQKVTARSEASGIGLVPSLDACVGVAPST